MSAPRSRRAGQRGPRAASLSLPPVWKVGTCRRCSRWLRACGRAGITLLRSATPDCATPWCPLRVESLAHDPDYDLAPRDAEVARETEGLPLETQGERRRDMLVGWA